MTFINIRVPGKSCAIYIVFYIQLLCSCSDQLSAAQFASTRITQQLGAHTCNYRVDSSQLDTKTCLYVLTCSSLAM